MHGHVKLIDSNVDSIDILNINEHTISLNLHHNNVRRISGLLYAVRLQHLDLSSNCIRVIEGLENLSNLRTLNLSSNFLNAVGGLRGLRSLRRLDLSFNSIENINGLHEIHGPGCQLEMLHLQGNSIRSMETLVTSVRGLSNLRQLTLMDQNAESNNPIYYRQSVLNALPQLVVLDHLDRFGNPTTTEPSVDMSELTGLLHCKSDVKQPHLTAPVHSEGKPNGQSISQMSCSQSQFIPFYPGDNCSQNDGDLIPHETRVLPTGHPQCPMSSSTEQRLVNLETQLSSLVALQMMRLSQQPPCDSSGGTCSSPPAPSPDGQAGTCETMPVRSTRRQNSDRLEPRDQPATEKPNRRTTPDLPSSKNRRADPGSNLPTATKLHGAVISSNLTCVSTVTADVDAGPSRPCSAVTEEHPPGAPKKPSRSKATLPKQNPHPAHGRPLFPRRPSSTPCVSTDHAKTDPSGTLRTDPNAIFKSCANKACVSGKRSDVKDTRPMSSTTQESITDKTFGGVLKELDSERSQRKENERRCQDLTERIQRLEASAVDESKALEATNQLKQAFSTERRARLEAESRLRELDARMAEVLSALDTMRARQESEKSRAMEENARLTARLGQLVNDHRDAISRAERAEKKLDEAQCMLKTLELEYKELISKPCAIDSPEVTRLISARIDAVEARHEQTNKAMNEKLEESNVRFHALEEEFRLALRIEADRYGELYNTAESLKEKLLKAECTTRELEQREESARHLIADLTAAMKEQKAKALNQQKSNLLIQHNQKERLVQLEAQLEEAEDRAAEVEALRKANQQLKADVEAKESLVMGLRAERRNWSEELAKQSSALAQDRGLLEARIEAQSMEIASLKKNLEEETDNLKIKSKIIEDQANSIENMKKNASGQQAEVKRARDEVVTIRRQMEENVECLKRENADQLEKIERLAARKEELKEMIAVLQSRIGELESQNTSLNQRWSERASLLDKLEVQLEQMRESWEKEKDALACERDQAKEQVTELKRQMECMESEFRQQIADLSEARDEAICMAREQAEHMRSTCESRVADVEAEMRAVLLETENTRSIVQSRLRQLSAALSDPPVPSILLPPMRMCHSSQAYPHSTTAAANTTAFTTSADGTRGNTHAPLTPPSAARNPNQHRAGDSMRRWSPSP